MGLTYRYLTAQGIQMIKIIRQTTYADLKSTSFLSVHLAEVPYPSSWHN